MDKYRDTVRTQQATVGELEGEMDTMTEDISGLLERLLEGSGGQGVASALEAAENRQSQFCQPPATQSMTGWTAEESTISRRTVLVPK